ncbi:hypothetical protein GWI33_017624 [Rhynchophorus ferrugineus]|uniref:Uncharacterized protein n=1 Tax=Rhynchophorus ferrugineus TaxID=354439 RepID=A0A834HY59_RHYFE|nr:hypothetical protein GWI33_017624 [Rhynchophorus ferrugineus]
MSILDQTRTTLSHIPGLPPPPGMMTPHTSDGPPNSEVLLALLARNKTLEAGDGLDQMAKSSIVRMLKKLKC